MCYKPRCFFERQTFSSASRSSQLSFINLESRAFEMGNKASTFQYSPLQEDEIRLLRLRYSLLSRAVVLEIQHYPRARRPPYIALSYTWGSPENPQKIYLNGHKVEVGENLHSFLRHACCDADAPGREVFFDPTLTEIESELRYLLPNFDTLGHFWVDALCIDQNNIPERNSQVSRMKDIYEDAKKVVIWLGPAADDSDLAMDMIEHLARNRGIGTVTASTPVDPEFYGPPGKPFDDKSWTALLFHRQWAERAWIIQEATAQSADGCPTAVWCGKRKNDWHRFQNANYSVYQAMMQKDFAKFSQIGNSSFLELTSLKLAR